jgi:DHA2 family multidrug resistance protein-like MFS transporter
MNRQSEETESGLQGLRYSMAIASVLIAMVLVVLDASIANVALPTIAQSLNVTPSMSIWVITGYQSALVMALLPCAALGESFGYRKVFVGGVVVFVSSSVLCALSTSLPWLVAARFLQGLGGAAVMALGVALLRFVVPHRRLGAAIGLNALAVALSSAAGPTIAAAILSVADWRWLFAVNLPIGAVALIASRSLPRVQGTNRPLDHLSVALNAAAFASWVIGAEMLTARPVAAGALIAAGIIAMMTLIRRERPKQAPLIPLDLLRVPSFRVSVVASVLCFSGVSAAMVSLPFYLQHGLHLDVWMTGMCMTPWPMTVAIAAPLAGRLANHVSTARLCAVGGLCLAIALAALATLPFEGHPIWLALLTMLCGLGFGLFQVPNNQNMFLSAPRERSGAAGGLQGTARLTGQTAGAVQMSLLLASAHIDLAPRMGLGLAALLVLVAGLVSLLRVGPCSYATAASYSAPTARCSRY